MKRAPLIRVLALLVLASAAPACKSASRSDGTQTSAAPTSATLAPPVARRARKGGTDVTFFATSDTHFGVGYPDDLAQLSADPLAQPVGLERTNRLLIDRMNTLEKRAYPASLGGVVGRPRGVLVAGDLTDWARPEEWARFVAFYGKTGKEGALRLPVFEVIGNHDRIYPGAFSIEEQVVLRHGGRFYSWDWDDLHVAALGEAPGDDALEWLRRDLDALEPDVPVALYFHRCLAGPYSTDNWFGDGDYRERLASLLAGRNVVGIFHGHHHATGHYVWHGIDVYKVGAVKNGPHVFTVVHLVDAEMSVATFDYDADSWAASSKKPLPAPRAR